MKRLGSWGRLLLACLLWSTCGSHGSFGQEAAVAARPITPDQLQIARARVAEAARQLDQFLHRGSAANADAWKQYLLWDKLSPQLDAAATPDVEAVNELVSRMRMGEPGLELPAFLTLRESLIGYSRLLQHENDPKLPERVAENLRVAQEAAELAKQKPAEHQAELATRLEWLEHLGQAPEAVSSLRRQFAYPNLLVSVDGHAISKGFSEPVSEVTPINEQILKTRVTGTARTQGEVTARLVPSTQSAIVEIHLTGNTHSDTVGRQHPVTVFSRGLTQFQARKRVFVEDFGLHTQPASAHCDTKTDIYSIRSDINFGKRFVEKIAWKQAAKQKPLAEQASSRKAESRIARSLDERVVERLAETNTRMASKVRKPLERRNLYPQWMHLSSTAERLHFAARQSRASQLAAPSAPPSIPNHHIQVQVHESMVTNSAVNAIGGLTVTDERARDLAKEFLGEVPAELEPKEGEDDWSISFDLNQPVSVQFRDDTISIAIRGRRFKRGDQVVSRPTQIGATYKMETVDGRIRLVRQGAVDVTYPDKNGETLNLTEMRNKTFISRKFEAFFKPTIDREGVKVNDRWKGLADMVLQFSSANQGWLSLGWN